MFSDIYLYIFFLKKERKRKKKKEKKNGVVLNPRNLLLPRCKL
jgi:hypothetical protein